MAVLFFLNIMKQIPVLVAQNIYYAKTYYTVLYVTLSKQTRTIRVCVKSSNRYQSFSNIMYTHGVFVLLKMR